MDKKTVRVKRETLKDTVREFISDFSAAEMLTEVNKVFTEKRDETSYDCEKAGWEAAIDRIKETIRGLMS